MPPCNLTMNSLLAYNLITKTMSPKQNGWYFTDDISKRLFLIEKKNVFA